MRCIDASTDNLQRSRARLFDREGETGVRAQFCGSSGSLRWVSPVPVRRWAQSTPLSI